MKAITFLRFGIRHFLPFVKRVRQLLRRKEREVQLEVTHRSPAENSSGLGVSSVVWTIVTRNAWAIRIGEFLLPVFEDSATIRITWPLAKGENRIVLEALGIANKKSQSFVFRNEEPEIHVPGFPGKLHIRNTAVKQPAFTLKQPVFGVKRPAAQLKSQTIMIPLPEPKLRRPSPVLETARSLSLPDLTADLFHELNQIHPTK